MNTRPEIKAVDAVKTTKQDFPQIYAYTLPDFPPKNGWIKIGYTDRESVETRIKEQTHTAAIRLNHETLWAEPAKFPKTEIYFKDHQFHTYLTKHKKVTREQGSEWFYYNGTPDQAHQDFYDFLGCEYNQAKEELSYTLRSEQQQAVDKTLKYAKNTTDGEFLWNAKPRFGKTLTTYDFALKLNVQNVLIVTNRPAIANSWFDDFEKFIAWQSDFAFVSESESLKNRATLSRDEFLAQRLNGKKKMLAFLSLQDLKGSRYFGGQFDKLSWVKETRWDLLVIDEAHEGVDTLKTYLAFDNIQRRFTLHLSGTPFKALASGKFSEEEIYNWSYADEQKAKAEWQGEENNPYANLPKLNMFSYQMSRMITDQVNQGAEIDGENHDYAFDLNEFFATNENGKFIHEKEVKKWLDTLTRNEKYPFSTPELRNELKHTFWLLDRVASAKALEKLLKNSFGFSEYEIVLAAGDGKNDDSDEQASGSSLEKVRQAIKSGKKTITLSVGQLTTGITVPEWTAVLMLSNLKSPALYMQAAFRAQNPWSYSENDKHYRKENAYLFDFAPERTLQIYDDFANNLAAKTAGGGGTSEEREQNIKELLNFFPVIAEDSEGKMVEINAAEVLSIPKAIKAAEVVKRGFLSNLLFANISNIFGAVNSEVLEILEQLPIAKEEKIQHGGEIDTQGVEVDSEGNAIVAPSIVISETQARFGEKQYKTLTQTVTKTLENPDTAKSLSQAVAETLKTQMADQVSDLAKEKGVSEKFAQQIVERSANEMKTEIERAEKQAEIERFELEKGYKQAVENAENSAKAAELTAEYQAKRTQLEENQQQKLTEIVQTKAKEIAQTVTESVLVQAETLKKAEVENDIRDRLRGFSRTIPAFLMAYGTEQTTLANFDQIIPDHVFQEVTGITLAQFRVLRDEYRFFDEPTFNESVKEFLAKRVLLANYFDENQLEDIFSYIPPQKTNQIFTPRAVVQLMLDKLEEENPEIFQNPELKFADLYVKSGLFLTEITKRLFKGLAGKIPNEKDRLQHILENQIYGFAPSEIIFNIAKNFMFNGKTATFNTQNLVCLDTTPFAMQTSGEKFSEKCKQLFGEKTMKFDVVVGNPPYQESRADTRDESIYHLFYDLAEKFSKKYCLISPARFLFNAGSTDKDWNKKMLSDPHIKVKFFEQDSKKVFPGPEIKGGVAVLYRNSQKNFGEIGIFTIYEELNSIIHKVAEKKAETLDKIMSGQGIYKFTSQMHKENPQVKDILSKSHPNDVGTGVLGTLHNILFFEEKPKDQYEYSEVLGRYNNDRAFHFIRTDYINEPLAFDKYRVVLPKANGTGKLGETLSSPLIVSPYFGFTQTFISIGAFDGYQEAESCLKYIKSKFARTMLGVLKITQDNPKDKWKKVPLQDFTPNSDIDWTKSIAEIDQQLYQKYGLDEKEIAFIEEKVREME